ncbi:MAG: LON peptidase substrate-binding domain-containing protein [Betaproteobacteria bacterium]
MAMLDFLRRPAPPEPREIPVFPLNTVLFPGGVLGLKVFEPRYLDMAAACLHEKTPFGICLVAGHEEENGPSVPHPIGTLANIVSADMEQPGILLLSVRGGERFRILESSTQADGLLRARIDLLPAAPKVAPPPERRRLLPLLLRVISDVGETKMPGPHAFDDAEWVGYRLTEILPVQNLAKQKLLELEDALVRLEILEKYLDQRKLLG